MLYRIMAHDTMTRVLGLLYVLIITEPGRTFERRMAFYNFNFQYKLYVHVIHIGIFYLV